MFKKIAIVTLISSATLIVTGCASVMTADTQSINITTSNNQPAEVTLDDKTITAPGMVVVLRDGKNKVVKSKAPGCDNATVVDKNISGAFFGNIIIGGLPGSTTDSVTGKMWNYVDDVEVTCTK
ncbi:MAG: adenosine deaminase [Glaciecola sp.]|jgi:hypothetical protein